MIGFTHSCAVIIGIDDYAGGIPRLATAVNDATHLAKVLETEHGYEIILLTQGATQGRLAELFTREVPGRLDENARLLVYFAGHGIALDGDDGPAGYLLPQDARPDDPSTFLAMIDLHTWLTALPCRHMLAILDCCFAGAFRWASTRQAGDLPKILHKERFDRYIQSPAWQVITSASYDQRAIDILTGNAANSVGTRKEDEHQHSPFAQALFAGLQGDGDLVPKGQGDGVITASELALYLRQEIEVEVAQRTYLEQTPQLWPLNKHRKGEFIFLVPGHPLNLPPAEMTTEQNNPYRGLQPYEREHQELFFGRKEETEKLFMLLQGQPFVAVLGASGTGKSSLVKAGLLPRLTDAGPGWYVLPPIRPSEEPARVLSAMLRENLPGIPILLNTEVGLAQAITAWQALNPKTRLALTVDQCEELVTLCRDDAERVSFLALLAEAVRQHPDAFRLIITLRTDFEPRFTQDESPLAKLWQAARYVVPPMDQAALRDVIEGPASVRVLYFEPPELVDELINEVIQMPGALPLLSFTLSEMYLRYVRSGRDDRALTQADYEALGGVIGSLRQRATEEYDTLPDDAHRETMQRVMLRMISADTGELARRRVSLSELEYPTAEENQRVKTVLDRLVEARLLVRGSVAALADSPLPTVQHSAEQALDREDAAEPYVEPAHDALVETWDRLLQWKREAEEYLPLQRRTAQAAQEWERAPKSKRTGLLWNDDPRLPQLERALAPKGQVERRGPLSRMRRVLWPDAVAPRNTAWLNRRELAFTQASVLRRVAVLKRIVAITAAVIVALAGLVVVALVQAGLADQSATEAKRQAAIALSRQLAAQSRTYYQNEPDLALLLAIEGSRIHDTLEARGSLLDSLAQGSAQEPALLAMLSAHNNWVMDLDFAPAGDILASAGADSLIILWDVATRQPLARLDCGYVIRRIAFSPDGKLLAAGLTNGDIYLWDVKSQQITKMLKGPRADVRALAFSPDGQTLASGGDNGQVLLWDVASTNPVSAPLPNGEVVAYDLAFSPNGHLLAASTSAGTLAVWDIVAGLPVTQPFEAHQGTAYSVAFSPDGTMLASAGSDKLIRLWDVATWQPLGTPLAGHKSAVKDVTFSPDGALLASAGDDNTVLLWDVATHTVRGSPLEGHNAAVFAVTFSPDGTLLASGGKDKSVALWQLGADHPLAEILARNTAAINGVAFNPNGKLLVSSDEGGNINFWDAVDRRLLRQITFDAEGMPNGLGLSSNGGVVAASSSEGTISLWNSVTGQPLRQLTVGAASALSHVAFSADGSTAAVGGEDGSVVLWDLASGRRLGNPLQGSDVAVMSVAFSPDKSTLAAGDDNGNVYLWDLKSLHLRQRYALHQDTVWALAFSPNGKLLASGSTDRIIRLTDLAVGAQAARILARHENWVYALAFDPSGTILASGSRDGTVLLWDVATGEPLGTALAANTGEVFSLAFSPDGRMLSAGSGGPETLVLWDVDLASWQARACRIANRNLTEVEWERFIGPGVAYQCTCPEFAPGEGAPADACATGK